MSVADYDVVIGLEVHCQLKTATKMFTACRSGFGADPNTQTDAYTLGLPGTLPVPSAEAVRSAIRLALACGSTIHPVSRFARKHYFYPDLPKGYQITQSDHPYATGGAIEVPAPTADDPLATRRIRLVRIHMEEDAGKNLHLPGDDVSLVDYNRAGAPLLEIVGEPDIRSPAEAADYLRELRTMIRYLDISDANMEEGTLRCDANVSLMPKGSTTYGTRCEIKNLNSFRFLELAIAAEMRRQAELLDAGERVVQSTLTYDTGKDRTRVTRTKEEAADYRYFPEPDLPPLVIPTGWIEEIAGALPEMPAVRRRRYASLGLSAYDANVLTADQALADFFDAVLAAGAPAKQANSWVTVELVGRLKADDREITASPVTPTAVAEVIALIDDGTISGRAAKEVFDKAYAEGGSPRAIVERDGYRQVSDADALRAVIRGVIAANPHQLAQYLKNPNLRGWFVGQVMKQTKGQANPGLVQELLTAELPPVPDDPAAT
jgi:aspartyl-tRNA(Asn)/glutamyl-tRNA(Gln) amidotransferase subunit B